MFRDFYKHFNPKSPFENILKTNVILTRLSTMLSFSKWAVHGLFPFIFVFITISTVIISWIIIVHCLTRTGVLLRRKRLDYQN